MFTDAEIHSYPNDEALRLALRRGEVDFIFGDGISLAFWINGTDSADCCAFSGGAVRREPLFRRGHRWGFFAVRKGNDLLRQALNWRCSGSGKKAATPTCGCAIFSVSPF